MDACGQWALRWGPVFLHGTSLGSLASHGVELAQRGNVPGVQEEAASMSTPSWEVSQVTSDCWPSLTAGLAHAHKRKRRPPPDGRSWRPCSFWDPPPPLSHLHPLPSCPPPHATTLNEGRAVRGSGLPRTLTGKKDPKLPGPGNGGGGEGKGVESHCKPPTHTGVREACNQGEGVSPGAGSGARQPHCATRHWSMPRRAQ